LVLAESGIFLPANENLTRKPKTKKPQFCQWDALHPISFNFATTSSYSPVLLFPTSSVLLKMNDAATHAGNSEKDRSSERENHREREDADRGKSSLFTWSSTYGDLGRTDEFGTYGRTGFGADEIWGWLGTDGRDLRRIRGAHIGTLTACSSSGGHASVRVDVRWFWAD
jgi:hypothetical protein